jgi:hypothetical protein
MTTELAFRFFDCDNHYYEALDAFTRHIEPAYRKRAMQWALVGEKVNKFIPKPTFDPVAAPGVMDEYFRGVDHILMGSDYPHVEGLADPASYIKDLQNFGYTAAQCQAVMRDNGRFLATRRPA